MNLVDSSGWLEYFANGKNARFFAPAIEYTKNLIVSTINIFEVYKKIITERNEANALQAIGLMQQATVVDVNSTISIRAAKNSAEKRIPMSVSLIYQTARMFNAIV